MCVCVFFHSVDFSTHIQSQTHANKSQGKFSSGYKNIFYRLAGKTQQQKEEAKLFQMNFVRFFVVVVLFVSTASEKMYQF